MFTVTKDTFMATHGMEGETFSLHLVGDGEQCAIDFATPADIRKMRDRLNMLLLKLERRGIA